MEVLCDPHRNILVANTLVLLDQTTRVNSTYFSSAATWHDLTLYWDRTQTLSHSVVLLALGRWCCLGRSDFWTPPTADAEKSQGSFIEESVQASSSRNPIVWVWHQKFVWIVLNIAVNKLYKITEVLTPFSNPSRLSHSLTRELMRQKERTFGGRAKVLWAQSQYC